MSAVWIALQGYGIACGLFLALIALSAAYIACTTAISRRRDARAMRRLTRGAVR